MQNPLCEDKSTDLIDQIDKINLLKVKKRHAVHLNDDTWQILRELSEQISVSMATIIHTLLIERDNDTLTAILRTARGRRRGRPKQSFFTD